ncbi:MAG TPA: Mut7-C RNAse domain-containing protein, partial [Methylophilaceae bacterium]|nr:Mut7-C RNAse domain-containing protein [Methylophilaceae bacterium]
MKDMPRFLCDEMLGHLCRYLRAAGYDALLARDGASDASLLQQCHAEERQFLTKDTLILEHKAAQDVAVILPSVDLDHLAALVSDYYQLDWLSQAFSRCLMDNTLLVPANESELAGAPGDVLDNGATIQ